MAEKALVRTADNTLLRIEPNIGTPLPGLKAGLAWMDVERVSAGSASTTYSKAVVTQAVVGGKWRITTTTSDLAGAELTAAKAGQVSDADRALLEGVRLALNGLYYLAKQQTPSLTKGQFATALNGLSDFSSADVATFLVGKL